MDQPTGNRQLRIYNKNNQYSLYSVDEVIANTPYTTQQVLAVISILEIRRLIRRLSGQYVSRI